MSIEKFNPKYNPKYIKYIYLFLKKEFKLQKALNAYPRIVKFKHDYGWYIGYFLNDGLGDFIGSRVLYGNQKVEVFCFVRTTEEEVIEEIKWEDYERIGGCLLIPWRHQWIYTNKHSRKCKFCGQWERKVIKTVKTVSRQELWKSEEKKSYKDRENVKNANRN